MEEKQIKVILEKLIEVRVRKWLISVCIFGICEEEFRINGIKKNLIQKIFYIRELNQYVGFTY